MSETNHPPSDDSLNLAKQIDALSDEFEEILVGGGRPKIEEFLLRFDAVDKQQLLIELIEIEVHYRRQIGETITLSEYQCRFPGLAASRLDTTVHDSRKPLDDSSRNSAPDDNIVVKYFGEYELLQVIARGGMGIVYKARQESLNRIVALKMIISGEFASTEEIDRFYSEAHAAALLDHPGIVPIFEVGEHDGKHYFSMAFVEGTSLATKLSDGPLDPKTAARTVWEVADAVQYGSSRCLVNQRN